MVFKFLNNYYILIFRVLLGLTLFFKISNWFIAYSAETNNIINITMFCLIGIAFLAFSWAVNKIIIKLTLLICGIFLIAMNFIPDFETKSIIGITCLLLPLILAKLFPEEEQNLNAF